MKESLQQKREIQRSILLHTDENIILKMFAEDEYPLDSDGLEILYLRNFSQDFILKCVAKCKFYNEGEKLYNWLCGYLGEEKAEDFILQNNYDEDFLILISDNALERNQRWDILQQKKADDILYKHGLYDKMSAYGLYMYQLYERYFRSNWRIIKTDDTDAMEYLAQTDNWNILFKNLMEERDKEHLLEFYAKHEKFDSIELVDAAFLASFSKGLAYLQQNKKYSILAHTCRFEYIDWDEYLNSNKFIERKEAVKHAERAKQWDALMKNHQHWVLLKHGHLWKFIKSFF